MGKRRKIKRVEFVGVPSSGKTTVYRHIKDSGSLSGSVDVLSPGGVLSNKKQHKIYAILLTIPSIIYVLYWWLRYTKFNRYNILLLKMFLKIVMIDEYMRLISQAKWFLGDTTLHFLSAFVYKKEDVSIAMNVFVKRFSSWFTYIVHLGLHNTEIMYARMNERTDEHSRDIFNSLSEVDKKKYIERQIEQDKVLRKIITKHGSATICVNSGPIRETSEQIVSEIQAYERQ